MYAFDYHRPNTLSGALADLKKADAKALAGGMTLLPTMKQRLASPSALIELKDVPELRGLAREGDALTIGGSLANNDPAADYPAAALGLAATIVTNKRRIAADDFFKGLFETALDADELITSVSFPIPERAAYMKFANPASRYALVGVFIAKTAGGVRVAVTGAGENGVFRASAMEAALKANFAPAALASATVSSDGLNTDIHADAEYRAHLIKVMARRAVEAAS